MTAVPRWSRLWSEAEQRRLAAVRAVSAAEGSQEAALEYRCTEYNAGWRCTADDTAGHAHRYEPADLPLRMDPDRHDMQPPDWAYTAAQAEIR